MFKHRSQRNSSRKDEKTLEDSYVQSFYTFARTIFDCLPAFLSSISCSRSTYCITIDILLDFRWENLLARYLAPEVQIKGVDIFHNLIHGFLKQSENERVIVVVFQRGGRGRSISRIELKPRNDLRIFFSFVKILEEKIKACRKCISSWSTRARERPL